METPDRTFESLAMISAWDKVFLSIPSRSFLSNIFHCGVHRFGTLCPFSCKSPTIKGAIDHVLDHVGPFCTAAWPWGAFISHFIYTTLAVIDENVEASDPLKVTEVVSG